MLSLLGGSDERTVDLVKKSLMENGQDLMPSLIRAREMAEPDVREHLESVLNEIGFNQLETSFVNWSDATRGDPDLEEGAALLAKFRDPEISFAPYKQRLDSMAHALQERLRYVRRPSAIIDKINQYLFTEQGFYGNTQNYYDPDNTYLTCVLDHKMGIPISLSVVYLLLSRRLCLPISGISLPGHFILKYEAEGFMAYLDAFNQGQVITREECIRFLIDAGYGVQDNYFEPATNRDILHRMMRNLIFIYNQKKETFQSQRLMRLIQTITNPPS